MRRQLGKSPNPVSRSSPLAVNEGCGRRFENFYLGCILKQQEGFDAKCPRLHGIESEPGSRLHKCKIGVTVDFSV